MSSEYVLKVLCVLESVRVIHVIAGYQQRIYWNPSESVLRVSEIRQVRQCVMALRTLHDESVIRHIFVRKRKAQDFPSVDKVNLLRFQRSNLATSPLRNALRGILSGIYITGIFGYLFCAITVIA